MDNKEDTKKEPEKGQAQDNKGKQEKTEENQDNQDNADLLNGFEENNNLNLTDPGEEGEDDDPQQMNKIKEEYEKFMKEMQGGFTGGEDMGLEGMGAALGDLIKGLAGEDGENLGEDLGSKFAQMFKNFDSGEGIQNAAQKLLAEFMDKSLLEEPLKETDQNYIQYFKKQQQQGKEIEENYKKQHEIVKQILQVLEKEPSNKNKMIALFEEMQKYGNPPESIAPVSGFF